MKKYICLIVMLCSMFAVQARPKNEICLAYNASWFIDNYPVKRNFGLFPYFSYRRALHDKHGILFHCGFLFANYRTLKTPNGRSFNDLPVNSLVHRQSFFIGLGYFYNKNVKNIFDNRFNAGIIYRPMSSNQLLLRRDWFDARVQMYGINNVYGMNIGNSVKIKMCKRWSFNADIQFIHYFNKQTEASGYDGSELKDPQLNTIFFNAGFAFSF